MKKTVVSSGFFDPIHIGHIRYLNAAKKLGDYHIVLLDDDKAAVKKKGFIFMNQKERREIVRNLRCVDKVIYNWNTAELLKKIKPHIFAKGGDRSSPDKLPKEEVEICRKYNIKMVFGVGGKKIQSSSWLLNKINEHTNH